MADAFPLCWPHGRPRTKSPQFSQFKTSFAKARDEVIKELGRMGVRDWNIIISSNIPLRRDGLPYAGQANPNDPAIAVYFRYKEKPHVFACDRFRKVEDNLWAICKTIEALRGIQRWGTGDMMERAFTGFAALPAPNAPEKWNVILGVSHASPKEEIKKAYREKAKQFHPDVGGHHDQWIKIQNAYEEGMRL